MKFIDLLNKEQMDAAYAAGKRLAKMVSNIDLAPKQPSKKASFGEFFQATLPQKLDEISSPQELKEIEDKLGRLFSWTVHCSQHFVERVFDRESNIPVSAILLTFRKLKDKYRIQLANATQIGEVEVVVKDYGQKLNVVFVLREKKMDLMTIMVKDPERFVAKSTAGMQQIVLKV